MIVKKDIGTITVEMENISSEETERIRQIIHTLISQGALHIKNGCAILRFDSQGILQQIEIDAIKWRRDKIK